MQLMRMLTLTRSSLLLKALLFRTRLMPANHATNEDAHLDSILSSVEELYLSNFAENGISGILYHIVGYYGRQVGTLCVCVVCMYACMCVFVCVCVCVCVCVQKLVWQVLKIFLVVLSQIVM